MIDLAILGAGPAGLGAAARAARDHSVTVFERSSRVGGAAGSFELHGVRVDLGSHRLHPSIDERILRDLTEMLGADLQRRPRRGRIRLMGRWIGFPLNVKDLARHMPPSFVAGAARDALTSPFRRAREDTFEDVLVAGLGRTICERFYFPYARKIWGVEPRDLSGEQARRRVTADSPLKIVERVLRGSGSGGSRGASYFLYPRRGYGQISEALADAAVAAGANVRLSTPVTSIEAHNDAVVITAAGDRFEARRVFSTIPLPVLARMMNAPRDVLDAAARLRSRAMLLVYLVLATDRYTQFDAHYLPEEFTPITRVSEPKNYRDGDDPPGTTVLCCEIPCSIGDPLWELDDGSLGRIAVDGLREAELPPVNPTAIHVERLPSAYPIYTRGFERDFEIVDRWVGSSERVLTFGRQGLFAHDNAHHALAMAYAAVDALQVGGGFDSAAWRHAREGFTHHVVED